MKASRIEVVFITKNPDAVARWSPNGADERTIPPPEAPFTVNEMQMNNKLFMALGMVSGTLPVEFLWADYYKGNNITWINQNGIARFPSIQITATYPNGKEVFFRLNTSITDQKNYSPAEIADIINASATGEFGGTSWLCKLWPPLCTVDNWVWLAVAGVATYGAFTSDGQLKKVAFIAGAGLSWNEFFQRGGFKALQTKKLPSNTKRIAL